MALPRDLKEKHLRLTKFKEDIEKLSAYISKNFPDNMDEDVELVDVVIGIMEYMKG